MDVVSDKAIEVAKDVANRLDTLHLIITGAVMLLTILVIIGVSLGFRHYRKKAGVGNDLRRRATINRFHRWANLFIITAATLLILQINGINVSAIVLLIVLLAAVAVLAVKDSLQDVFAGIGIMMDTYYRVGDAVEYEGRDGVVIGFNIRTTKIEYLEDRSVDTIANRHISRMRRLTHLVDIDLPLSYDEDRQTVFTALTAVCEEIGRLDGVEDCEFKGTQAFGESAVFYKIRFFCEPHDRPDIRRAVMATVQDGLARAGLQVPYNQLDVHTK